MPDVGTFPDIGPHQSQVFAIDFGQFLENGAVLTGTPSLSLGVNSGNDPAPSQRVLAGPTIGTVPVANGGSGVENAAVLFKIGTCLPNVTYSVDVYCSTTSVSNEVVEGWGRFSCVAPR